MELRECLTNNIKTNTLMYRIPFNNPWKKSVFAYSHLSHKQGVFWVRKRPFCVAFLSN